MTRINLVKPQDLADQHLFAEWREIKMVPAALRRSLKTKSINETIANIPKRYTLNTGHVTFFYNKMLFLYDRYALLTQELEDRGYNLRTHNPHSIFFWDIPDEFKKDIWEADVAEIKVNIQRILLRINEKVEWYKHLGEPVMPGYFETIYSSYN